MEDTFALIKPDAFGQPWLERLLEKNDEEPPEVDEDDEGAEAPPAPEPWKDATAVRAPDMATEILARIEREGFEIVKRKTVQMTHAMASEFYAEHTGKPFFAGLVSQMTSAPCLALVLRKEGAIKAWRKLMGATNPAAAREAAEAEHPLDDTEWTLRALFGDAGPRNATHGSDSPFSALREISLMFPPAAPVYERAVLVVSGGAAASLDAITADLEADAFVAVATATKDGASGLVVEGMDARRRLRLRAGPPEVATAKDNAPASLRAKYAAADGDIDVPTDVDGAQAAFFPEPLPLERTLALIKPGVAAAHGAAIVREVQAAGFTILAEARTRLSRGDAEALLAREASRPNFHNLVSYMSSGPVIALALSKPAAIRSWAAMMGPASAIEAAEEAPHTLRGRFGMDAIANAVGGSADAEAANREICFFFPHLHPVPLLQGAAAKEYITEATVATVATPMGPVPATLHSTLVTALTELCKHKPTGVEAVEWLGRWLLANNPRGVPLPPPAASASLDAATEEYKSDPTGTAPPEDAAPTPPTVIFVLGGASDTATALSQQLAARFTYTHIDATESAGADPAAAVALVKEAMSRAGTARFIVQGFPASLPQAMLFEQTCTPPAFVLAAGDKDAVTDFYDKVGIAHGVAGSGEAAFAAAVPHFLPKVVFVVGRPRTGRTGLCHAVSDRHGYTRLALEDLVRAEAESGSVFGRELADTIARGDQVPMDAVLRLFKAAMSGDPTGRYLVDGYPRTVEQARAFGAEVAPPEFVVLLDCPEEEVLRRGGAAARKGCRVFASRTQAYVEEAAALGLVRTVDANRPASLVTADVLSLFDPEVVFALGGPGAGKGTQCARLSAAFGHVHLSAGDLLRAEVARQSPMGQAINDYIIKGQLVPVEVTLALLKAAMAASGASKFLIDGFPRAGDQSASFEGAVCQPSRVLFLDAPDAVLTDRLLQRGKTSGRADDNAESIKARLVTFHTQSVPVLDRYSAQGKVVVVDGSRGVEDVADAVADAFRPTVVVLTGAASGEQAARVAARFGYTRLSVDAIVGAEIALGTRNGERLEKMVAADDVPTEEVVALLTAAMARSRNSRFVLDGFPRTQAEAVALEASGVRPNFCMHLGSAANPPPADLAAVHRAYQEEGRLLTVLADGTPADTFAEARKPLQPEFVVMLGATGSGRGEFARRAGRALGYARLRITHLLRAEAASGSVVGKVVARAMAARRTVPTDAVVAVIRAAVAKSPARRFLLDGYPRVVSDGFPTVQDQVFALEDGLGPIKGVVVLDATVEQRKARVRGELTPGQARTLDASVDAYRREKLAVVGFFERLGKVHRVDTGKAPEDVFTDAAMFLE